MHTVGIQNGWQRLIDHLSTVQLRRRRSRAGTPDPRRVLSEKVQALFDRWHLAAGERIALLGLTDGPTDELLPDNHDTVARAEHLLEVEKALHERFRERPYFRDRWVGLTHPRLCGRTPLEAMQQGGPARMRQICAILRGQTTDFDTPPER
jgi:hypothetical protein